MRTDVRRRVNLRARGDDCRWMDARRKFRLREKDGERLRERDARIRHADEGFLLGGKFFGRDDGCGRTGLGGGKIFGRFGKSEVAGLRAIDHGKARERGAGVAQDFAGELFRDFCSGKRH